jgi:type IV secretion system protein VirB10
MQADPSKEQDVFSPPEPGAMAEPIVSVNDRGRRGGGGVAPFIMIGAIVLVVLVFGALTLNVVRSKLAGPKERAPGGAAASGLSRSFATEDPPPLPGAASATADAARSVRCPDGSSGSELRGTDGVVVRNAAGQSVRVCPNGQVLGASHASAAAQPIPVVRTASPTTVTAARSNGPDMMASEAPIMLNDGKYGAAQPSAGGYSPDAVLAALQAPVTGGKAPSEGLLTEAPADALERQLTPSTTPMVQASRLADLSTLLPKGRTIDCGLSVRVVSSLAGLATCIVTQNVYSANGRVLLIERGSEAVGEYRSGVTRGQRRLFILWNRIITPAGVVINLQSPGADPLGGTGLEGQVDNHWFERIGSAFLLSTIQDGIQYEIADAQARSGGATFVLGNTAQTGNQMAQRVLDDTIGIPPTIYKNQGDRTVIYVARDLDFSSVYTLRARP